MAGGGGGVERGLWIVRQRRALLVSAPELRHSGGDVEPAFRFREGRPGFSGPEQSGVDFSVLFLFKGLQGGKFSCPGNSTIFRRERKPPGSTKVAGPSRRASDSFSVSFLINGLQGEKFPCHQIRAFRRGWGAASRRRGAAERHQSGEAETVRVRCMRDPEPHVRSLLTTAAAPRSLASELDARKFRGGRGRNLRVRFLRGDGHDGSE